MTAPTRPVLRYHGGKWRLAPWILSFFPAHRVYVEPFGGAASVLMRKPRSYAEVYNDLDGEVVNVFRVLRDPVAALRLHELLMLTPWSRREFYDCYTPALDPVEQARRTIARGFMAFGTTSRRKNRTGFRGKAYRQRQSGVEDWVKYPQQIAAFVARLRGVCLDDRDALEVIAQQDEPQTLFYVDPPYPVETRTSVKWHSGSDRAYAHDLTGDDHRRLADRLRSARGMVVLSGYACDLYDQELYADWERHERETVADGARPRTEVIWLNAACVAARAREAPQRELPMEAGA